MFKGVACANCNMFMNNFDVYANCKLDIEQLFCLLLCRMPSDVPTVLVYPSFANTQTNTQTANCKLTFP